MSVDEDPVIGKLFNTPEKKAKWVLRIKIAYIIWIVFLMVGIITILLLLV